MRTTSHIMGYSKSGEGAEMREKRKTAYEILREHQIVKEEAAKKGERVKLNRLNDDKRESPEDLTKPNGTTTPPLTTKAVFGLTAAKKRKVEPPEEGEIQSPKKAKIGSFSDRALKPKPGSIQMHAKQTYKGTTKPQSDQKASLYEGIARPQIDRKVSPYKGNTRPQADRKVVSYKETARPAVDAKKPSQTAASGPPVGPKQPYKGTARPPTQTGSSYNTGSSKPVEDPKSRDPERSPKRKAEEEPARERGVKAHKAAHDQTTAPYTKDGKPGSQKPSCRKPSLQRPTVEKPSHKTPLDQKPSDQKVGGAKSSAKKTLGEENTLREKAQEQGDEKKCRASQDSDKKSSAKKRKAEDQAECQTKKIKSGQGLEKKMQPGTSHTATDTPPSSAAPKGLDNFGMACFANSVVQCLANIPEFVDFYRAKAHDTVKTEPGCVLTEDERKQFERKPKGHTRAQLGKRYDLRKAFKKAKSSVRVQAYLGALFERMQTAGPAESSVSPVDFMYALGLLVEDDNGHPLDGEEQADAWEFYYSLLHHLEQEEMNSRNSQEDPTTVKTLLGSSIVDVFSCSLCGHSHEGPQTAGLSLDVSLPRVDKREKFSLTQCLDVFVRGTVPEDYKCDGCGKSGGAIKSTRIKHAAKYPVIKLTRTDNKGKIGTHVPWPTTVMDLGSYFADSNTEKHHHYEVMGVAQHIGKSFKEGHWLSSKKVDDRWWFCSDANVFSLDTEEVAQQNLGCLFFLKKVG